MFRDYSDCSEEVKEEIRRIKFKPYYKIAMELKKAIKTISNIQESHIIRLAYIKQLKLELTALLYDKRLDEFTVVYRDTKPSTKVNVGYDTTAVAKFATQMLAQFPYEDPTNTLLDEIMTFLNDLLDTAQQHVEQADNYFASNLDNTRDSN